MKRIISIAFTSVAIASAAAERAHAADRYEFRFAFGTYCG
jgi:hypothetical protein